MRRSNQHFFFSLHNRYFEREEKINKQQQKMVKHQNKGKKKISNDLH